MPKRPLVKNRSEADSPAKLQKLTAENKKEFLISDLPLDCLCLVFSELDLWHHNRARAVNRYFFEAHNLYLKHEFQKSLKMFKKEDPNGRPYATLLAIKRATEIFNKFGFEEKMLEGLLSLLRQWPRTPFNLEQADIKDFLLTFYDAVNEKMLHKSASFVVLAYAQTLLNLLKAFNQYSFIATEMKSNLNLKIEIPGIWLGSLLKPTNAALIEKFNLIFVMLAHLLTDSIAKQYKSHGYSTRSDVYSFGSTDTSIYANNPKTLFFITACGSKRICEFIKSCADIAIKLGSAKIPSDLSSENFTFNLDVLTKRAHFLEEQKVSFQLTPKDLWPM